MLKLNQTFRSFADLPEFIQAHILEKHSCNVDINRFIQNNITTGVMTRVDPLSRTGTGLWHLRVTHCNVCGLKFCTEDSKKL